jgi:hypothetical protein
MKPRAVVITALISLPTITICIGLLVMCVHVFNEEEELTRQRITTEQRENEQAIKEHRALIGMTAAWVRQAWGEPKRITRTVTGRGEYEEWHYGSEEKGATLVSLTVSLSLARGMMANSQCRGAS